MHQIMKGSSATRQAAVTKRCLRAIVCSIVWLVISGGARAETIDRVLAVVAGRLIMLSDVTAARDLRLVPPGGGADPVREVLTRLIDRELVLVEVDRYAPSEPTADAVDREVQRVRARFASEADLDAALARSGIDEKHLRETLRQDLRMRAYLDQRFAAASDRRPAVVEEWMAGLRRRGDVMDLYLPAR
jgi:hypothetical protein